MNKVIARQVRITDYGIAEDGTLWYDLSGGFPAQCVTITGVAYTQLTETYIREWMVFCVPLNLVEHTDGRLSVRRTPADPPRPKTDTPASQFLDGLKQGQKDATGFNLRFPLPRIRRKDINKENDE